MIHAPEKKKKSQPSRGEVRALGPSPSGHQNFTFGNSHLKITENILKSTYQSGGVFFAELPKI